MKTIDVTKPVMEKVVRFEKKRSLWWLGKFFAILFALTVSALLLLWIIFTQIAETQTVEMLSLFTEDREIIAEFWQDTLATMWEELPQEKLIGIAAIVLGIIVFILLTRKMRMVVWRRIRQLRTYKK